MIKIKMNKKGVIEQLSSLIIPLVAIGIVLVIGFLIMAEVKTQVEAQPCTKSDCNTTAINATNDVINAIADIPGWLPIIVITVIGALLIGLVTMFGRTR